jgi:hypothetical protein
MGMDENAARGDATMDTIRNPQSAIRNLALWVIPLVTLIACAVVASRRVPLWVPGQCTWAFRAEPNFLMAIPPLALLIALYFLHGRLCRAAEAKSSRQEAGWVALLCALALLMNLSFRLGETFGFAQLSVLTVNPASGGFFLAAYDSQDDEDWLKHYPDLMKKYHHVGTHPPGGVALMRWWLSQSKENYGWAAAADAMTSLSPGVRLSGIASFCERAWQRPYRDADVAAAFWGGFTFLLLASLIPVCIYAQARVLFGARAAAHAATFSAMVPSFILFVPSCDLTYAFFSALTLAMIAWGTVRQKFVWLLIAGAVAGCGLAFSFAMSAILVLAIGLILLKLRGAAWQALLMRVGSFIGGVGVAALLLRWAGVDWLAIWKMLNVVQAKLIIESGRDYKTWLFFNLADFFTFIGLPVLALLIIAVRKAFTDWKDVMPLLLPSVAVILLTDAFGYTPAETARIWMLFMPPLLVLAGAAAQRAADENPLLPKIVLAAQAIQLLVFSLFINVWSL